MKLSTDEQTRPVGAQPLASAPPPDEPFYRRGDQARRWGGVLLLIGLVWLVFALSSRAALPAVGFVERSAAEAPRSFAAERVVVTGVADAVELVGWGEDTVEVAVVKHAFGWNSAAAEQALDQLEVVMTSRGATLEIEVRRPLGTVVGRAPYAELRIALPAGASAEASVVSGPISADEVVGDLKLTTVSGDLDLAATSGSLAVSTTSGDVRVRDHTGPLTSESVSGDLRLAGDLVSPTVKTVSGEASLEGASGSVELSSISGDLRLEGAGLEAVNIESTSGDIEARLDLAAGAAGQISNISGDVSLRLDAGADLDLAVSTASGDIESRLSGLDKELRSLRGTLGDGDASLTVTTTSGDVTVRDDD